MDVPGTAVVVQASGTLPAPTPLPVPAEVLPPAALPQAQPPLPALTAQALQQSLSDAVQSRSTALEFSIDESTHQQVVVVRDAGSGDVIFQCPSEEALRMIRNLQGGWGGLVDQIV